MTSLLDIFWQMTFIQASFWLLVENVLLFFAALGLGHLVVWRFAERRVAEPPGKITPMEIAWAISCIILNTVVTIAGWWMWKHGIIIVRREIGWRIFIDVVVLGAAMDLAMYITHRIAHLKWIYPWMHHTHHIYDKPRPLNLFVMSPLEVLGFGALWLAVITIYSSTWLGILIYLTLNLTFGTIGHLGVEPLPGSWMKFPLLRHLGTSTFHARHHQNGNVNYGFYTDVWDRIFKTMCRRYGETFGKMDRLE